MKNNKIFWIIGILLIIIPISYATNYLEDNGVVQSQTDGPISVAQGVYVKTNVTANLISVERYPGVTATIVRIFFGDGKTFYVQSDGLTGNNFTFSTQPVLNASQVYYVMANVTTGSYTRYYKNPGVTYPISGTILQWLGGAYQGSPQFTNDTTSIYNIKSITLSYDPLAGKNEFKFNGTSIPTNNYEFFTNQSILFLTNATILNNTVNCSLVLNGNIQNIGVYSNLTNITNIININKTAYASYGLNTYYFACNSTITGYTTSTSTNFYVGGILNITSRLFNGTNITNFNITLNGVNYGPTNGVVSIVLDREQYYNLFFDTFGYEYKNVSIYFNSTFSQYNFSVYTQNSINFTFKDTETKSIVNNVSFELISDLYSNNYSTSNGFSYLELLSPTNYNIRFTSPQGYQKSNYFFNLINRTHTDLTLYLVKNTSSTTVTVSVVTDNNINLIGAYVKSLRFNIATNSYDLQEICQTNIEGKCNLNIILNSEYYKFIIEYPSGTIVQITSPSYVTSTTISFIVTLGNQIMSSFFKDIQVSNTLDFNDATNNFRFTYSDLNNIVSQGCLKVYKYTNDNLVLYNSSCTSSGSATILVPVQNISGTTYKANGYVYYGSEEHFLNSESKTFNSDTGMGSIGLFGIFLITLVIIFIASWSMTVALILAPFPLLIGSYSGLIFINFPIALSMAVSLWIIAFIISRN